MDKAKMSGFVYALQCADDTFYIGKTKDIVARFQSHKLGSSQWTVLHPAKAIVELLQEGDDDFFELTMTLKFFKQHGLERVRGGPFARAKMAENDKAIIDMLSTELPFDASQRCVCVLQCSDNRFFVDTCLLSDLPKRFQAHCEGTAQCPFTQRFKATSIVDLAIDEPNAFQHLRLTLKSMMKYGVHNVRGSIFNNPDHTVQDMKLISRLIRCNMFPQRWTAPSMPAEVGLEEDSESDEAMEK